MMFSSVCITGSKLCNLICNKTHKLVSYSDLSQLAYDTTPFIGALYTILSYLMADYDCRGGRHCDTYGFKAVRWQAAKLLSEMATRNDSVLV